MIKLFFSIVAALILSMNPLGAFPVNKVMTNTIVNSPSSDSARVYTLLNRLNEIRDMDKAGLSFSEKRALRKEVCDIKGQMKEQGILLTVGLLAVIAMLLVIILDPFNK